MSDPRNHPKLPEALARALDAVRRRWLAVRVAEFPVWAVVLVAVAGLLQATADRWFELPIGTRAVLLGLQGIALLALFVVFVVMPVMKRPDRRKAALMVERSDPRFRTSLISAVEFADGAEIPEGSRPLVDKLLADAGELAGNGNPAKRVVDSRKLKRRLVWPVLAVIAAVAAFVSAMPLSPLLVRRVFLSKEGFPAETKVVDVTGGFVVPAGEDAVVSAKAVGVVPSTGILVVAGPDGTLEEIPVSPSRMEEGLFSYTVKNVRAAFSYRFQLNDGIGGEHRVAVRIPPVLKEIHFTQEYPKYTSLPDAEMSSAALRLMAGSKLRMKAVASVPLQSAVLEIKGVEDAMPLPVSGEKKDELSIELTVPERGWRSMSVRLVAEDGEASVNDPVYRIELTRDRPPSLVVTQPRKDSITVVPGERIPFAFRVGDDFGLRRVALSYRVFRPGTDGRPEPAEEGEIQLRRDEDGKAFSKMFEWDLSLLVPQVPIGGTIACWIEAEDNNPDRNAGTVRSAEKIVRIVSEEQKRAELLELLGERAKDIERLYEQQRGMNQKTDESIR